MATGTGGQVECQELMGTGLVGVAATMAAAVAGILNSKSVTSKRLWSNSPASQPHSTPNNEQGTTTLYTFIYDYVCMYWNRKRNRGES
jgi:hypothetical protein